MALLSTLQSPSLHGSDIIHREIQRGARLAGRLHLENIYWGSYYTKPSSSQWMNKLELVVAHLESDTSYSGGLRQYNVGIGKIIGPVIVQQDPPSQISNDQIAKALTGWISAATVTDLRVKGAYNIFLPPGTTASLSSDQSCSTFCLPPDELLLGDNKPISEFATGDKVVGASGIQSVIRTMARPYGGRTCGNQGRRYASCQGDAGTSGLDG